MPGARISLGVSNALAEHEHDIMDAGELLRLAERSLVAPLDPLARAIVAASAKRVSVVTAVSPSGVVDMLFVGGRICACYAGSPRSTARGLARSRC